MDVLDFSPWDGHTQPQQGRARGGGGTDARPILGLKIRTKANVLAESLRPWMATVSQGLEIKEDPPHRTWASCKGGTLLSLLGLVWLSLNICPRRKREEGMSLRLQLRKEEGP